MNHSHPKVAVDLSFLEKSADLWDTYELIILAYGPEPAFSDFVRMMHANGFVDVSLSLLWTDFCWYMGKGGARDNRLKTLNEKQTLTPTKGPL